LLFEDEEDKNCMGQVAQQHVVGLLQLLGKCCTEVCHTGTTHADLSMMSALSTSLMMD